MTILWALLFVVAVLVFWFCNLLGLPGNWMIVTITALYAWLMPEDTHASISMSVVWTVGGLALLGELVEFAASAAGVKKVGGSRRSAVLALVGSLVGAFVGLFVGVPIPVIGSVVAAILFAGLGALAGAMLGETWKGRTFDDSWEVGKAAFWGRVFGTLAKTLIGAMLAGVAIAAVCV